MDDRDSLLVGSLLTLGLLVALGAITLGTRPSNVGGQPTGEDGREPASRRGQGHTNYSGGTTGIGVNVSLGLGDDPTLSMFAGSDPKHSRMHHKQRYPCRSGEVLESLMYGGPGMMKPPISREKRSWLYQPPSREEV